MFQNLNLSVVEMDAVDALSGSADEDYSSLDGLNDSDMESLDGQSDTETEGKYELDVEQEWAGTDLKKSGIGTLGPPLM